jgi:hypothetical protein
VYSRFQNEYTLFIQLHSGRMLRSAWESTTFGSLKERNSTSCLPSSSATQTTAPAHRTAISCWSSWASRLPSTAMYTRPHSPRPVALMGRCVTSLGGAVFAPAMRAVSYVLQCVSVWCWCMGLTGWQAVRKIWVITSEWGMSVCVVRGHAFQPKDMFRAQTPMSGTLDHAT